MRFLLLLLLLAAALVAQAPAWLAAREVRAASMGVVELRNARGTLWRGQADAYVHPAAGSTAPAAAPANARPPVAAGALHWDVVRFDTARRAIFVEVQQMPPAPRPLSLAVGAERIYVTGSLRMPAAAATIVPLLGGWTLAGDVTMETPAVELGNGIAAGTVIAQWRNAVLVPPDLAGGFALGDVNANATLSGGPAAASVRNTGGDVELMLDGSSQARTITLVVQPRASASPAQIAWLQSHTMSRTPRGFAIELGWPGR